MNRKIILNNNRVLCKLLKEEAEDDFFPELYISVPYYFPPLQQPSTKIVNL